MDSSWYKSRDQSWTVDRDPDDARYFEIDLSPRAYSGSITATALTPVIEQDGRSITVSNISVTSVPSLIFKCAGAGGLVTFRMSFGSGESEDLTFRFRAL